MVELKDSILICVAPERVWAWLSELANPLVLGRLTARIEAPILTGRPHVVAGWRLGSDGRKHYSGTAVWTADGTLCAMAKRYVTDSCFDVADRALQLLGGYGYLREYGLEKIVRDLRVHRILEGTNEIMRVVIGRAESVRARASA